VDSILSTARVTTKAAQPFGQAALIGLVSTKRSFVSRGGGLCISIDFRKLSSIRNDHADIPVGILAKDPYRLAHALATWVITVHMSAT
jgi:hypothetical protein